MTFIALGLGSNAGYSGTMPTSSVDTTGIDDLYAAFEKKIGTGPKYFTSLSSGLSDLTDYKLWIDFGHFWNTITANLKNTKLPSVSLRSSILFKSLGWHYRDIIGYKVTTYKHKFWWFKWTTTAKWYRMHDNTCDGDANGNFYEKKGKYYQFQSAHVVKK